MLYLDSNVFVFAAFDRGPKGARAVDWLRRVVSGEEEGSTASLTLDEVVWKLTRLGPRDAALAQGERILSLPNLRIVGIGREEVAKALQLMNAIPNLRPRDAIHLVAAQNAGATQIVSDDVDFEGLAGMRRVPV